LDAEVRGALERARRARGERRNALDTARADDGRAEPARAKREADLRAEQEAADRANQSAVATSEAALAARALTLGESIRDDRARNAWEPVRQTLVGFLGEALSAAVAPAKGEIDFQKAWKDIGWTKKFAEGFDTRSAALLAVGGIAAVLAFLQAELSATSASAGVVAVASVLGTVTQALGKARSWLEAQQEAYQKKLDAVRADTESFYAELELRIIGDDAAGGAATLRASLASERDRAADERTRRQHEQEAIRTQREEARKAIAELKAETGRLLREIDDDEKVETESARSKSAGELRGLEAQTEEAIARTKRAGEKEIDALDKKVREHRRRAGITARSPSLFEFVRKRIDEGSYEKQLGIVHQVQEDLKELSHALVPEPIEEKQGEQPDDERFPRGTPRIVLIIDDLDRCPPKAVVEMLEAVQLLVKTRLFVVVLAMDVRYVTRALEKEYEGILVRDGAPSGLDYIEKIVQIPYRIPSIEPGAMLRFLGSQMTLRGVEEPNTGEKPDGANDGEDGADAKQDGDDTKPTADSFFSVPKPEGGEPIPVAVLDFEPDELKILNEACVAVNVTPRAGKRLVNVFKLLKIIWYNSPSTRPELPEKKAMIALLALSACFPEVMCLLLRDLEAQFHGREPDRKNLKAYLTARLEEDGLDVAHAGDRVTVQRILESGLIDGKLALRKIAGANIRLMHSFCFVGELSQDPELLRRSSTPYVVMPKGAARSVRSSGSGEAAGSGAV